uniref:C-type lectin domain-containing protein n=1 Tax=Anopheles funestus TaxID=62324 RepID=A0A182RKL7_ANOFN
MVFDKTLCSSVLVLLCVQLLAAATTKLVPGLAKASVTNINRSHSNSAVNNFPINGLPPLTYSTKKYFFYDEEATFLEAWNLCREKGQRLATIESYQDHVAYKEQVEPYVDYETAHWIAATNMGASSSDYQKFYWITNDRPVGYINGFSNWYDGEAPNASDQCVATYLGSALWIYGSCTSLSPYACEEPQDV